MNDLAVFPIVMSVSMKDRVESLMFEEPIQNCYSGEIMTTKINIVLEEMSHDTSL